jgi:hypothetical protein
MITVQNMAWIPQLHHILGWFDPIVHLQSYDSHALVQLNSTSILYVYLEYITENHCQGYDRIY